MNRIKCGKTVLNGHFLPQLRLLLRSRNETVRHEGVLILGHVVTNCSEMNPALGGLRKLRKAGDLEVDFFENSRHMQTYRRSRALLRCVTLDSGRIESQVSHRMIVFSFVRLAGILRSDRTAISGDAITQFLLPLTTCYLFDAAYDQQNHLLDASYECLQAMSKCLSWYSYEKLLRFFLANMTKQVDFQKQAVKAVVAVLNGFHFDLRNSQFKGINKFKLESVTSDLVAANLPEKAMDANTLHDELPDADPESEEKAEEKPEIKIESSTRIHAIIAQQLLPQLNKILTARSKRDVQHKSVKDHYPENDEILRVPIALALVSLLQNLPAGALERHLPG